MKYAYKKFDTRYLKLYERFLLHRWYRYFEMLNVVTVELQGTRDELNDRNNYKN